MRPWSRWTQIVALYLGGVALTTLIANLATTPFVLFHFNRFAVYGLAANLLAVPLTALWIMPWGLVAFLLMPLGLEELALIPMGWGIEVVITVARQVSAWPGATVLAPAMPDWGLALAVLGGLWLCLWRTPWRLYGLPVIVLGLVSLAFTTPPDVLVSGDARLMAVRAAEGGWLMSSKRIEKRTAESWLRMSGESTYSLWPQAGTSPGGRLACDSLGCLYRAGGKTVALVRAEGAFIEDCAVADVVIAAVPLRATCAGPAIIVDRFDLWRNGAYALWLEGEGIRLESVRAARGARPWVLKRGVVQRRTAK